MIAIKIINHWIDSHQQIRFNIQLKVLLKTGIQSEDMKSRRLEGFFEKTRKPSKILFDNFFSILHRLLVALYQWFSIIRFKIQ